MVLSAVMLLMSRVGMIPPPLLSPPVTWIEAGGGVQGLLECLPFTLPPPPEPAPMAAPEDVSMPPTEAPPDSMPPVEA